MENNDRSVIVLSLCFCVSSCFSVLHSCIQVFYSVHYFRLL